jgi:hypothetical protein
MMARRVVLVEVAVQPVFVLMDGDAVVEKVVHPVVTIPATDWPTYSSERFPREVDEWQAQLNSEDGSTPASNRAQRRRKAEAKPRERNT